MKNFFDCKDEKITERAFSQSLTVSVLSILLCLVVLCSMTYAWFSSDVSSGSNKLQSGHFSITATVTPKTDADTALASSTAVTPDDAGVYTLARGTYTVVLEPTGGTTVKGYCTVTVDGKEYRTPVIVNEKTTSEAYPTPTAPFVFYITIEKENAAVRIDSVWGVPAGSVIESGKPLVIASTNNAS